MLDENNLDRRNHYKNIVNHLIRTTPYNISQEIDFAAQH